MRVLVTGAGGQLGNDVVEVLREKYQVVEFTKKQLDVTNDTVCEDIVNTYNPDIIVHCAAFTNVDKSEDDRKLAYQVNVKGTRTLAKICGRKGVRFVYISTDYVFNGLCREGYTEEDYPHPLNVYGRTKRLGEKWTIRCCPDHLILRTSWLYGRNGHNFVHTILDKATNQEPLSIVTDQYGSPTYTFHVARHLEKLLEKSVTGVFHLSNTGSCSWYEFAHTILRLAQLDYPLKKITSDELERKATRPNYSILRSNRLATFGISPMPHWKKALEEYLKGEMLHD